MKKKIKCVCDNGSSLKKGEVYESEREDTHYFYIRNNGAVIGYGKYRFVEMEEAKTPHNVLDEIRKEMEEAKELVGKFVIYNNGSLKLEVTKVNFYIDKASDTNEASQSVREEAQRKGYCVYIISKNGLLYPYKDVKVVEEFINVGLNEQYSARVYKDKVIVGCQTFTIDKVKDILDANKKLK
jgi:hypothetical protein